MKLNLGCGLRAEEGFLNVDILDLPTVDQVLNLDVFPYPFESESIDEVLCRHFISHIHDINSLMLELDRVTKYGGILRIYAPHFSSDNYKTDPTHQISIGYRSLNYFVNDVDWPLTYVKTNLSITYRYLSMFNYDQRKSIKNIFYWTGVEYIINKFPRIYEKFFSSVIPCNEVYFELRKVEDKDL
ncbi:class I SAM-dependent methyltransferase [Roseobacter sp. HKCCA2468]|uniref:class I SAM-dependent methyltransferase n=1 Tax=Roseobacter sp. HKCCA2468 TaxID=3120342 RepID=UPI0030EC6634